MSKSARTIFCRHCGAGGAHRHGKDVRKRVRYKCPHCFKTFTKRTNALKSGSRFSDEQWRTAVKMFCFRAGTSGSDLARFFDCNEKTGQRMNRIFRITTKELKPRSK